MAYYRTLRIVPFMCLNIKPKFQQALLGYATLTNHFYQPRSSNFCSNRNYARFITQKLMQYNANLKTSNNSALSVQRCISTTRSRFIKSQRSGSRPMPNVIASTGKGTKQGTKSTLYYIAALGVVALGLSYAAVPLYRIFCQAYSYGGTTQKGHDTEKIESMKKVEDRVITVRFNADTAASMTWNFRPQQHEIKVLPGETALAFYTARNPTNHPVIGVSTYNVIPFDAGQYFNKIQCFCFEEQLLNPHEEVHMPVFFYIDPEFADDPKMENVDLLTLSYTFFEAREGIKIPIPNFARN